MNASPRTSTSTSSLSLSGIDFMVLAFCVTFSPVTPSPLVPADINIPFSYFNTRVSPSILNSTTYLGFFVYSLILLSKSLSSPAVKALLSDIITLSCLIGSNLLRAFPPTLLLGESGVLSSGYLSSRLISCLIIIS